MFGHKRQLTELQKRLTKLEERIADHQQWHNCQNGNHVWEMSTSHWLETGFSFPAKSNPYIRCKHCYIKKDDMKPKKKASKK